MENKLDDLRSLRSRIEILDREIFEATNNMLRYVEARLRNPPEFGARLSVRKGSETYFLFWEDRLHMLKDTNEKLVNEYMGIYGASMT